MFWKYLTVLAGGIVVLVVGLSLAYRYELEWLRIAAMTVPIVIVGTGAMLVKRRDQRRNRTDQADSLEHQLDLQARAGAYVLAIVATALAVVVAVAAPAVASWVILLGLFAVILVGYGVVRLRVNHDARQ